MKSPNAQMSKRWNLGFVAWLGGEGLFGFGRALGGFVLVCSEFVWVCC